MDFEGSCVRFIFEWSTVGAYTEILGLTTPRTDFLLLPKDGDWICGVRRLPWGIEHRRATNKIH